MQISMYLQEHPQLLNESNKIGKLFEVLCEKMMKRSDTNEVMAIKLHYFGSLIKMAGKSRLNKEDNLDGWIKRLVDAPYDQFVTALQSDFTLEL